MDMRIYPATGGRPCHDDEKNDQHQADDLWQQEYQETVGGDHSDEDGNDRQACENQQVNFYRPG